MKFHFTHPPRIPDGCRITENPVRFGSWIRVGDTTQGFAYYLRDYDGINLPAPGPPEDWPLIREFSVAFCPNLRDFNQLANFINIETLHIVQLPHLRNLDFLRFMPHLRYLHSGHHPEEVMIDYSGISYHSKLEYVGFWGLEGPESLDFLEGCHALKELTLGPSATLRSIDSLYNLPSLQKLAIDGCDLVHPSAIENLLKKRPELQFD